MIPYHYIKQMVGNHQTPIEKNGCLGYQVDMLGFDVFYPTSIASLTTWRRLTKAPAKEFCLKKNMEKNEYFQSNESFNAENIRKNHVWLGFYCGKNHGAWLATLFFNKKWMLRLILPNL